MINEIKRISELFNYSLMQAEKLFFQDLVLFIIYLKYSKEIVFKGGTALAKCYGFDRFSEDLDFSLTKELTNFQKNLETGLNNFNWEYEIKEKNEKNSNNYRILIQGPLTQPGNRRTYCSVRIELSLREQIYEPINLIKIKPMTNIIPMFDVSVMNKKEIFAEKIRTLFMRKQARDLYDLYYLDDSVANIELINKKLAYYNKKFSKKELLSNISSLKPYWDKEMKHLVRNYPSFINVRKKIVSYF